jgi:hypothetical protein
MPVNSQFLAARSAERRFRLLAHTRAVCWLALANEHGIFAHTPLLPLTERHRAELTLLRCAFFTGGIRTSGDVVVFLWRLHPFYRAPQFGRERWMSRRVPTALRLFAMAFALGSWRAAWAHARVVDYVRCCDLQRAIAAIHGFLDNTEQDAPGAEAARTVSLAAPDRRGVDNQVEWLMANYAMTHDQALDFPIAVANQLYRDRLLQRADGELEVFAPSDALL